MDDTPTPTVLQRVIAAGLSEDSIRRHIDRGVLRLDGVAVTDPDMPAPEGTRIVIWPVS